jgi:hypothetical protein
VDGQEGLQAGSSLQNGGSNAFHQQHADVRKAVDLSTYQRDYLAKKGQALPADFDYAQLADMRPREAFRYKQPSPPPMPRRG